MSVYTLPISALVDKLVELVEKYEVASKAHAVDKANFENLKNQEDSYLSILKLSFQGSNPEKETQAYASEKWKEFESKMASSRLAYYVAQSDLKVLDTKIESMRTIISVRKEEINKFQG